MVHCWARIELQPATCRRKEEYSRSVLVKANPVMGISSWTSAVGHRQAAAITQWPGRQSSSFRFSDLLAQCRNPVPIGPKIR